MADSQTSSASLPYRPQRPKRKLSARIGSMMRLWARDTFSRESFFSSLRTLLWVVPLTVLIWVYAEREQLAYLNSYGFSVRIKDADKNRVITFVDPVDGKPRNELTLHADLSGPHGQLELVRERLEGGSVPYDVDLKLADGPHTLSSSTLGNSPLFVENGISVANISPAELHVLVDPIVPVKVPVQPAPQMRDQVQSVTFEPATVQIFAPRSFVETHSLVAYANLHDLDVTGAHEETDTLTSSASESHLRIEPAKVLAKVLVKKKDVTVQINSMPVWAEYPPAPIWDKYRAKYEETVQGVSVIGPEEIVSKINDPSFEPRPRASFDVTHSPDLRASDTGATTWGPFQARLKFDLPEGVHVAPQDASKSITYTIVERKTSEGG